MYKDLEIHLKNDLLVMRKLFKFFEEIRDNNYSRMFGV